MTRRVLAIRPRTLGDVVLTTPALRALAQAEGPVELHVATERPYVELLEALPEVARVWCVERGTRATARLGRALHQARFDVVVDFFGNPRTALLARASGAPVRAGYDLRGRRSAYTVTVPRAVPPARGTREYAADVHVRLACAVGGKPDSGGTRIVVLERARAEAERLVSQAGVVDPARTIGVVPAGSWGTKTWPWSHSAVYARKLQAAGFEVLALIGPGEHRAAELMERWAPGARVLPPCDVPALAAVIARLHAVTGTDSGPRHLAAALGVPSFAWFGPTHPDTWNPPDPRHGYWWTDLPCRGCDRVVCPHWNCMPGLDPGHAAERVLAHLAHFASPVRAAADLGPAARA